MTRRPAPIDLDALIAELAAKMPGLTVNGVPVAAPTAAPVDEDAEEREFQAAVVKEAKANGWKVFHVHNSRKSERGWPDLAMARGNRLLLWELKTATGTLDAPQETWREVLSGIGGTVEYAVLRPADWPAIVQELTTTPAAPERGAT